MSFGPASPSMSMNCTHSRCGDPVIAAHLLGKSYSPFSLPLLLQTLQLFNLEIDLCLKVGRWFVQRHWSSPVVGSQAYQIAACVSLCRRSENGTLPVTLMASNAAPVESPRTNDLKNGSKYTDGSWASCTENIGKSVRKVYIPKQCSTRVQGARGNLSTEK
jgi:hypothetical protein